MKKIFIAFLIGLFIGLIVSFIYSAPMQQKLKQKLDKYLTLKLNDYLNKDFIQLKSGEIIEGLILKEGQGEILIKAKGGIFNLNKDRIKFIIHNKYREYLKKAL